MNNFVMHIYIFFVNWYDAVDNFVMHILMHTYIFFINWYDAVDNFVMHILMHTYIFFINWYDAVDNFVMHTLMHTYIFFINWYDVVDNFVMYILMYVFYAVLYAHMYAYDAIENFVTHTYLFFINWYVVVDVFCNQVYDFYGPSFLVKWNATQTTLWFPWLSFFTLYTLLGLIYVLTFLVIYKTENPYYLIIYTIFFIFLMSATLVTLDLDIFSGFLLLIESVVILMFFFLVIYLNPNINVTHKVNNIKIISTVIIFLLIITFNFYLNLSENYFFIYTTNIIFLEDFYEALNDLYTNDLSGLFINLYVTNSLLLIIVALMLLIASMIAVILSSFFTKKRNFNVKTFLNIFTIFKTCYSFIFLRKQNLANQSKTSNSTRIFKKKTMNSTIHAEYKEKYEIFEKKKKDEAELNEKLQKEDALNKAIQNEIFNKK